MHVTTDYYTRIEQGRMTPARDLVRRLADALHLDGGQLRYALALLDQDDSAQASAPSADGTILCLLTRLLDAPAIVIGTNTSILHWNDAATALFVDFSEIPEIERTFVHLIFSNPPFQSRFRDLTAMKDTVVGILRSETPSKLEPGRAVSPPTEGLSEHSEFHAIWTRHDVVQPQGGIEVRLQHPVQGDSTVDLIALRLVDDPTHRILVFAERHETQT